jgi:hypothetical protein
MPNVCICNTPPVRKPRKKWKTIFAYSRFANVLKASVRKMCDDVLIQINNLSVFAGGGVESMGFIVGVSLERMQNCMNHQGRRSHKMVAIGTIKAKLKL